MRLERGGGNGAKVGRGVFIFRVGDAGAAVNTRDLFFFFLLEMRDGGLVSDFCELGAPVTHVNMEGVGRESQGY